MFAVAVREGSVVGFSPWLVDGGLLPVSFHSVIPLCMCVSVS